jgi:hypothetical protein
MMKRRIIKILAVPGLSISILLAGLLFLRNDADYFHVFHNNDAACANCLGQVALALRMYSQEFNGHFPAGKEIPLDSLALLAEKGFLEQMNCYTSHALGQKLSQYYKLHKSIPENLCCYRYNEGLTESAPPDLVLMYYHKPIKWAYWGSPEKEIGRLILFVDGHKQFFPEYEFNKLQKDTLDWIDKNR